MTSADTFEEALVRVRGGDPDLVVVSLGMRGFDGLRLCSQLRSLPEGRNIPILVVVSDGDRRKLTQALEMGVNDYLTRPVDKNELVARVRTQLRKKRYADRLRHNVQLSLEMAITDQLTAQHNRRYISRHLDNLVANAKKNDRPIAFVIMDIDYFKSVNDTHGHDIGDEVLKEFASRISANVRGIDLACRYGGEEFVVVMPDTDVAFAYSVSERLRHSIETTPFRISRPPNALNLTISIGIAGSEGTSDTAEALLHRADQALYRAKKAGRNKVVADAAWGPPWPRPLFFLRRRLAQAPRLCSPLEWSGFFWTALCSFPRAKPFQSLVHHHRQHFGLARARHRDLVGEDHRRHAGDAHFMGELVLALDQIHAPGRSPACRPFARHPCRRHRRCRPGRGCRRYPRHSRNRRRTAVPPLRPWAPVELRPADQAMGVLLVSGRRLDGAAKKMPSLAPSAAMTRSASSKPPRLPNLASI